MDENSPYSKMKDDLIVEFNKMGLINEEKANALVKIYTDEIKYINSEASKAALALIKQDDDTALNDARVVTETRKARGYDDNMLIEIMKAQGGLASFAVNANSDSAQSTIDDLHVAMEVVKDRTCAFVCDMPAFEQEISTLYNAAYNGEVYGGSGLTYAVSEAPALGSLVVNTDGSYIYTPQNDTGGIGSFKGIITATDSANGLATATVLDILVTDIV